MVACNRPDVVHIGYVSHHNAVLELSQQKDASCHEEVVKREALLGNHEDEGVFLSVLPSLPKPPIDLHSQHHVADPIFHHPVHHVTDHQFHKLHDHLHLMRNHPDHIIRRPANHHHHHYTEPADHYFINKISDHDYIPPPPPYLHPLHQGYELLTKASNSGRYYIDPITFKVYQ